MSSTCEDVLMMSHQVAR